MHVSDPSNPPPARLIFINRYFHPDHSATSQMLSDLAFALAGLGYRISIITSRQRYDAPAVRLPGRETIGRVDIHRVPTTRFGRYSLPGRLVDYLTFYASAAWRLWRLARQGDIVIAKTDPPMLSLVASPLARLRGARQINWLQDIFPEVAAAVGIGGRVARVALRPMRSLRNRSLRGAVMNVVVGDRMADALVRIGIARTRIRLIPNWADGNLIRPIAPAANTLRGEWGLGDVFTVGYSGNLGRAHDIDTMLAAMAATRSTLSQALASTPADKPVLQWLFIGGGALFRRLQAEVASRLYDNVHFKSYQPRDQLAESLSAIDVHLITLRPALEGLIVPSKFYGITAAGRPAVFIGDLDGEIARLLQRHGCGLTVAQGDGAGLARAVTDLAANPTLTRQMGERARRAFEAEFDKSFAVASWDRLLNEVRNSS